MNSFLLNHTQMVREHQAWLVLVRELKRLELDINVEEPLHAAIVFWAEELVHLRMTQEREVLEQAYEEKRQLFNRHIGFLPMEVPDAGL